MTLYYGVLPGARKMYLLLMGLTLLFSLLLTVFVDESAESMLIRAVSVGLLIVLMFLLPLSQKVVVDETGIRWRNLLSRWQMSWSDMDSWDVQEQTLFVFDKGDRYRSLPMVCIDRERMLVIERELQKRLPQAPIPYSSSLRASSDWQKGKENG